MFSGQKVRWNTGDLLLIWVLGSRVRETLISGHQTFTRQMPCKARFGIGVMYFCLTFSFRYKKVKPVYRKWTPISLHAPRTNTFMCVYILYIFEDWAHFFNKSSPSFRVSKKINNAAWRNYLNISHHKNRALLIVRLRGGIDLTKSNNTRIGGIF